MIYGLEYKVAGARKWRRCSLTMKDAAAIVEQAEALAKQERWTDWRVVHV